MARRKKGQSGEVKQADVKKNRPLAFTRALNVLQATQTNADYLRISGIRWLPLGFCDFFSHLRILNLKGCALTRLPYDMDRLLDLRHLDISCNDSDLVLPASLLKCTHLQRLICSPKQLNPLADWQRPWSASDEPSMRLGTLCSTSIVQGCPLDDLDWLNQHVQEETLSCPLHTLDRCYECHHVGHLPAARVRIATVALRRVPLRFPFCSSRCLHQLQSTFMLEDALNEEKRILRLSKFGDAGFRVSVYGS
jgi:hypothetical protein